MRISELKAAFLTAALLTAALSIAVSACGGAETVTDAPSVQSCKAVVEDISSTVPAPPDGATACARGDCNYQTQAGCAESQACRPQFNSTAPVVQPGCESAGKTNVGDRCAGSADCVRGAFCALDSADVGTCRKFCCGADWSACDEGESCLRSLEVRAGGEVIPAGVGLCFPVGTCDPLDPASCAGEEGRECKIVDPTGAVACSPISKAKLSEACAPPEVCGRGLSCVGGYCTKLCAWEACGQPACGAGEGSCVHFERDPPGVGECTLGR